MFGSDPCHHFFALVWLPHTWNWWGKVDTMVKMLEALNEIVCRTLRHVVNLKPAV